MADMDYCRIWKDGKKSIVWSLNKWLKSYDSLMYNLEGTVIELTRTGEWRIDQKILPGEYVDDWLEENNVDLDTVEGQVAFKLMWL